jgi:hypothetical protein
MTGVMDHMKVLEMKAEVTPYADRLLQMDDLLPYQATMDAPEDLPTMEQDQYDEHPFEFARKGALTTLLVSLWILGYKRSQAVKGGEASSSKAVDDAGNEDDKDGK